MTVALLSDRLVLVRHRERRRGSNDIFVVGADYQVRWNGITVTVREGFGTDLSSVPKAVPKWLASKLTASKPAWSTISSTLLIGIRGPMPTTCSGKCCGWTRTCRGGAGS